MLAILSAGEALPLRNMHDLAPVLRRCRIEGRLDFAGRTSEAAPVTADHIRPLCRSFFSSHTIGDGEDAVPEYPELSALCVGMAVFPAVTRAIDRLIDPAGNMLDNASAALAKIRADLQRVRSSLGSIMRRVMTHAMEQGTLEKDAAPTVRDGRLVLPVAPMYKRKIPGIVHDESATGKTCYIEPAELVEANNRTRELELEEQREILRILAEFTGFIRPDIPAMLGSYDILGLIDFIMAKALYARQTDATLPHVSDGMEMEWYHAVHPVLLESLRRQGKKIVPLDITLTNHDRILVISGPNAGGQVGHAQNRGHCAIHDAMRHASMCV